MTMALALGCGSGGPGTGGAGVSVGPSEGQDPGFGVREEKPGRGFDKADEHQESPGGGWDSPGSTGPGPGPGGGGGGGGDFVGACKRLCARGAAVCQIDESECKAECDELKGAGGHPCAGALRAAYACADNASSVTCEDDGGVAPAGCEKEASDLVACLVANGDLDFTPPGNGSDSSDDEKNPPGGEQDE